MCLSARRALMLTISAFSAGCASHSSMPTSSGPHIAEPATASPSSSLSVPGVQRTATAVGALNAMADELNRARQTVADTMAALDDVSKTQGDLIAPFDRFIRLNEQLSEANRGLDARGDEMRSRARDYITNWEVEVYGVEDPDLRKQADVRRTRVRTDYENISDAMRTLRDSMDKFNRQAEDIQRFLSQDLTPGGVKAAAPAIGRAQESGKQLQQRIDDVISQVDRVAGNMTPATTEPSIPPGSAETPTK